MAVTNTSTIFNKRKKVSITFVDKLEPDPKKQEKALVDIDATVSEKHSQKSKVTRYPIEDGGNITDNCSPEPKEIQLEGVISNFPLTLMGSFSSIMAGTAGEGIGSALGSEIGAVVTGVGSFILPGIMGEDTSDRVSLAKTIFNEIVSKKKPVNIYTGIESYKDMLMTDFDVDIKSNTATSLIFKASFIQANFVTSELVDIGKTSVNSAGKSIEQGKKVPVEVTGTKAVKSESWLHQGLN